MILSRSEITGMVKEAISVNCSMVYVLYLTTSIAGFICLLNIFANANLKQSKAINKFLIIIFTFESFRFLAYGVTPFIENYSKYRIKAFLDFLNAFIIPCFYLYFEDLIDTKKIRINRLFHLLWVPLSLILIFVVLKFTNILKNPADLPKVLFSVALIFYAVYALVGYKLLNSHVWKRNSELKTVDRQNKIIRNWTIFIYSSFIALLLKGLLAFSMNHFAYNGESESMLLWLGALIWMSLFVRLMITPEVLYGFNIFDKMNENSDIKNVSLSGIWSAEKPITPIENERDKKLQEKIAPQLNNYLQRIENKLLFSDALNDPEFGYEELAAETGIPSSHLNFIFRYHSRESFNDCKKLLRIKEAVRMLEDQNLQHLTFEAIAQKVGFTSYTTFFNSFKTIMGITPLQMKSKRIMQSE